MKKRSALKGWCNHFGAISHPSQPLSSVKGLETTLLVKVSNRLLRCLSNSNGFRKLLLILNLSNCLLASEANASTNTQHTNWYSTPVIRKLPLYVTPQSLAEMRLICTSFFISVITTACFIMWFFHSYRAAKDSAAVFF